MVGRWLLTRDVVIRVLGDAPAPPATWLAVLRRTAVVVAIFVGGLATDQLSLAVLACFGALQVGLLEVAAPLGSLIRLMAILVIGSTITVALAMLVGGTWWMVVLIALAAYAFGSTSSLGPRVLTIGITFMALAVIFAGMPQAPDMAVQHALIVGVGATVQAVMAIVLWRPERTSFVRRALVIKLHTDSRLLRHPAVESVALIRTHSASDNLTTVISEAGLARQDEVRIRHAFSDATSLTRAIVAWMVMRAPGEQQRLQVASAVNRSARALATGRVATVANPPELHLTGPAAESVQRDSSAVTRGVLSILTRGPVTDEPLTAIAQHTVTSPRVTVARLVQSLAPSGRLSRHGLRMLVGLLIAEILTMLLPIQHSFWLPLTVVFTLKPDWAFTLVRGLNRTLGNLAAVIILPTLMIVTGDAPVSLVVPLALLVAITYRWFFGNYVIASFGLAGSILILDYSLTSDGDLFVTRIIAALLGAVLSLVVSLAIPTWSSTDAPGLVSKLDAALVSLQAKVTSAAGSAEPVDAKSLDDSILQARAAIQALDPVVTGALLEPRRAIDATGLAMVLAAGSRLLTELMALGYLLLVTGSSGEDVGPAHEAIARQGEQLEWARTDLDQALGEMRSAARA